MIWADHIVEEIKERFAQEIADGTLLLIRDEKTLSGRVHVGSLRGVVIHGLIGQMLSLEGIKNTFRFELNEFDPMDGLPVYIDAKKYKPHMGRPLYTVPNYNIEIDGKVSMAKNYAMVFGDEFADVVRKLQFPVEFYHLRPLYEAGEFNDVIREALHGAADIRTIYREVSGSVKPDDWYPLQIICPQCGKIGTTQVTSWNNKTELVTYVCKKDLVSWAEGCGHEGEISPLNGNGKLAWKVEWPAKWKVLGVHIEGCGKDHSAAGGSRDIGAHITKEIFHYPEPVNIPYEFITISGGKKMSASKGLGATSKHMSDLLPPKILKLLMMRKQANHPVDFDPYGNTIPLLFDEYDRLADHEFKRHPEPNPDYARTYQLCQLDPSKDPENLWHMRFSVMSFVLQMPHLDLEEEAEKLKESPLTENEKKELQERAQYVQYWLDNYAPDEYKFTILDTPPSDLTLDDDQKVALSKLTDALANLSDWSGKTIHETIHAIKEETGIEPKKLFQPLYQMFLGRTNGPQVGWFLGTMKKEDVLQHLRKLL
ncbi:lysine--tRNA ligase [Candidatus Peregrinibacteria bacterium CG10_big_fil_rev_8_21_14_0_10_49_16]|nr:MAG: lysine--tRNA ligase [Candidatus Peregrinibacteria bacterium CG22_combo_CG10-13_8_21_14_all_49_11]PIR51822.1 MAG: lysine--tRNA ligase [Candidatus Peregrinibacteria bacterium CG10_big_fil_rev_8_21_14_0_10_49_16]